MMYKVFCMDIDGLNNDEDPFGYGIRVDGKIILGARAQEWLEKSIQEKQVGFTNPTPCHANPSP